MHTVTLPNTDLVVSSLCLGSTDIGSTISRAGSFHLLDAFVDAGGNFVDTASVYANWLPGERSISEKTIGAWLKQSGKRNQVVIATKGAHPEMTTMHISRMAPADIVGDLDASLRNLQVDTIDFYYLHRDDPRRPVEEVIETLDAQVRLGKIRYFGCSNWRSERIVAAQEYARSCGSLGFSADQMMWSLAEIDTSAFGDPTMVAMDDALWSYHQQSGMATIAYSSQANGFFHKLAGDAAGRHRASQQRIYAGEQNQVLSGRVQQLAQESGLTITQIVLGYLLSQPFTTVPIVGCKTLAHLRDSLTAADVRLTGEQMKQLMGK